MIPKQNTALADLFGDVGHKMKEWAIWYKGDPQELMNYYAYLTSQQVANGQFWASVGAKQREDTIHAPLASDIASTSANLLFGEPPEIEYDNTSEGGKRITQFLDENGFQNKLMEGAELAAGYGGVFLKLNVDPTLADVPILRIRNPMQTITRFRSGYLTEVTFWRIAKRMSESKYIRVFEERKRVGKNLQIQYQAFEGGSESIGRPIDMPESIGLPEESQIFENFDGLGAVYIPNILPNRFYPNSSHGMSDYAQCIGLLDAFDETWTSWMKDITLGQGRIFVDQEILSDISPRDPHLPSLSGSESSEEKFDAFQSAFIKVDLSEWNFAQGSNAKPIDSQQFEIRVEDHKKTAVSLMEQIVTLAGYSPQTFGLNIEGRAESGTALRIRERKSYLTQRKKAKYWSPQLRRLLYEMQQLDRASRLAGRYQNENVEINPEEAVVNDQREVAETIRALSQAEAVSTEMKIRMAHPDWSEEQVVEEKDRILNETGMFVDQNLREGVELQ